MEKGISELEERKIYAALQEQISVFTSQQSKNFQSLKILIDQLRLKQISNPRFDTHSFSLNIYRHHQTIQQLLEKIAIKMKTISPLEKLSIILLGINKLFGSLLAISNNKWCEKLKRLEEEVNSKAETHSFDSELCSGCKQNRWHQLVKWQNHQINFLRIEDRYNYYQEGPVAKEFFGQEINQKVIQQKLAQLASGVEMEQECLRKLIEEMNLQQKTSQKSMGTLHFHRQNIPLPIVPMLRSVFHKIRVKKQTSETGIQVQICLNSKKKQTYRTFEQSSFNKQDDLDSEKDKPQFKLLSEIAQKSLQIKILQQKIELMEKNQSHLKMSNEILMQQNMKLQKRNSFLEVEINMTKLKPIVNRFKVNHKTAVIKADTEINREEKFEELSTTYNTTNAQLQSTNYHDRPSDMLRTTAKMKTGGVFDSKFKQVTNLLNKAMLSPSYEEKSSTKSITSSNHITSKLIHRDSGKSVQSSFETIKENPFKRPSIHKNDFLKNNIARMIEQNGKTVEMSKTSKSQRKLKQNGINKSIAFTENNRDFVRSENISPEIENRSRRVGKFPDRQSLLKVLFNYEMKDNKEKLVDFDFFKKSYERFMVKMVSVEEEDSFGNTGTKSKHLHKKSTLSIKQYLRHDMSSLNEGFPTVNSTAQNSILHYGQRQQNSFEKIRQMQRYLAYQNNDKELNGDFSRKAKVLTKQQLALITQILAYLIQMKVTKKQSYKNMRQMILGIKEPVKGKEEENQIKEKIANILRYHRGCSRDQGKGVCEHIKSFIGDIIGLISL